MTKKSIIAALLCGTVLLTACGSRPTEISVSGGSSGIISNDERSSGTETSLISSESVPESSGESDSGAGSSEFSGTSEQTSVPASEPENSTSENSELSTSGSVALYCVDDHRLMYGDNEDKQVAMASITKVLTACVALSIMDPETVLPVGTERDLVNPGSSICYISQGQRLKLKDLISGMMIASGNDAAYTVAVNVARAHDPGEDLSDKQALEKFSDLMNAFAARLGMNNSHFANPDGWDDEQHYTTANDLIILAEYALTVPEIRENAALFQKRVVYETGEIAVWTNSNQLLNEESPYYCENAIGMKTGTTNAAGCCLLGAFEKNGKTYITVVTGAESNEKRYEITNELFSMC